MFTGLLTIAGGILAASALIIARKPNAKQLIDKLTPYQGWIGIVLFFWGAWDVIGCIRFLGLLSTHPVLWIFALALSVARVLVGFLLGFGLITKYTLGSSPAAQARGQQVRMRLAGYQGLFGIIAIVLGAVYIVWLLTL